MNPFTPPQISHKKDTNAHQNAFASNNYGLSSAVSMLLFVIIIIFSFVTNRSLRED